MPAAPRHAKPRKFAPKLRTLALAATALAGAVAAFVFLREGSAAQVSAHEAVPVTRALRGSTSDDIIAAIHRDIAARMSRQARSAARAARTARRRHLAALRLAKQQAAAPSPSPSAAPPPSTGADPAHSALGICIRNAEEGGSYAWGPGNGGGAYQFLLSTWEEYGGAANQYGVAGPAYQDQIFDNAIAAGGASNWTSYDGC
jgi:hypothetical protein